MADFVFNIAKGKIKTYAELAGTNDALIAVLLLASGLEADATLKDYDDLAALLGGTSNEATDGSYSRKTLTAGNVTLAVDDTNDWLTVDYTLDITWTALAGGAIGKLLVVYDPDTTTGTDSTVVPVAGYDFAVTPDSTDVVAQVNAAGLFRAA